MHHRPLGQAAAPCQHVRKDLLGLMARSAAGRGRLSNGSRLQTPSPRVDLQGPALLPLHNRRLAVARGRPRPGGPPAPWTTNLARSIAGGGQAATGHFGSMQVPAGPHQIRHWASGTSGLTSGPSRLNIVRSPGAGASGAGPPGPGCPARREQEGNPTAGTRPRFSPSLGGRPLSEDAKGFEHVAEPHLAAGTAIAVLGRRWHPQARPQRPTAVRMLKAARHHPGATGVKPGAARAAGRAPGHGWRSTWALAAIRRRLNTPLARPGGQQGTGELGFIWPVGSSRASAQWPHPPQSIHPPEKLVPARQAQRWMGWDGAVIGDTRSGCVGNQRIRNKGIRLSGQLSG